jgi:hypothetical protein
MAFSVHINPENGQDTFPSSPLPVLSFASFQVDTDMIQACNKWSEAISVKQHDGKKTNPGYLYFSNLRVVIL